MSGHRRAARKPVRAGVRSGRFQQMLGAAPPGTSQTGTG
jgi:hypothetical protein